MEALFHLDNKMKRSASLRNKYTHTHTQTHTHTHTNTHTHTHTRHYWTTVSSHQHSISLILWQYEVKKWRLVLEKIFSCCTSNMNDEVTPLRSGVSASVVALYKWTGVDRPEFVLKRISNLTPSFLMNDWVFVGGSFHTQSWSSHLLHWACSPVKDPNRAKLLLLLFPKCLKSVADITLRINRSLGECKTLLSLYCFELS